MSKEEQQDIALTLLELDPMSRQTHPDWDVIRDAPRVWEIGKQNITWADLFTTDDSLFPLPGSEEALATLRETNPRSENQPLFHSYRRDPVLGTDDLLIQIGRMSDISNALR